MDNIFIYKEKIENAKVPVLHLKGSLDNKEFDVSIEYGLGCSYRWMHDAMQSITNVIEGLHNVLSKQD